MEKMEHNVNVPKKVPDNEIEEHFVRSGGKGGQNVNKLSTKVDIRWNVAGSKAFTEEEKARIMEQLKNRMNKNGEVVVTSQEERSQAQNRARARDVLNELVTRALMPEKERISTAPTKGSRDRRIEDKIRTAEKKKNRSWRGEY